MKDNKKLWYLPQLIFYVAVHPALSPTPKRYLNSQLRTGYPTAHEGAYLPLLPPGPDGVCRSPLRRTHSSTPLI